MGNGRRKYINIVNMFVGNIIYLGILSIYRHEVDVSLWILVIILFLTYYIFDSYNIEDSRESYGNLIRSGVVNVIFALLTFLITNNLLMVGTLYTATLIYQAVSRFAYNKIGRKRIRILQIGSGYKSEMVKALIEEGQKYISIGIYTFNEKGEKLKAVVEKNNIDMLVMNIENTPNQEHLREILEVKMGGLKVMEFTEFYERETGKVPVKALNEEWFLYSRGFNILHDSFKQRVKRIFDFIFSFGLLVFTFPIMVISAVIIKLESKGPVFFVQERIGKDDKPFNIVKFRSMKLHDETKHSMYAGEKDSRITKFGGFMRKSRIDELPQLWNILKGDMSFIGPRAEWSKLCYGYMEKIPFYSMRHTVLPGITGWAQVNYSYGASLEDAVEKFQYDLYYIKDYSLVLDIIIVFKTIKTVIFGRGR